MIDFNAISRHTVFLVGFAAGALTCLIPRHVDNIIGVGYLVADPDRSGVFVVHPGQRAASTPPTGHGIDYALVEVDARYGIPLTGLVWLQPLEVRLLNVPNGVPTELQDAMMTAAHTWAYASGSPQQQAAAARAEAERKGSRTHTGRRGLPSMTSAMA